MRMCKNGKKCKNSQHHALRCGLNIKKSPTSFSLPTTTHLLVWKDRLVLGINKKSIVIGVWVNFSHSLIEMREEN